jgi:hypothetical protein
MNVTTVSYPGLQRAGRTLIAAGLVGFFGFLMLDFLLPIEAPSQLRMDRFKLSAKPALHSQSKAPDFLELTDGAMPARIPNFGSIEPVSTRQALLNLEPGTIVTVVRPLQPTTWFNGYDILALSIGDTTVLSIETTLAAHGTRSSAARTVCLGIAAIGTVVLLVRSYVARRHDAA